MKNITRKTYLCRKKYLPSVIVLSGLPLTGKTTIAAKLKKISNLHVLDVDVIRGLIYPATVGKMLSPERELTVMADAYDRLCRKAKTKLIQKRPIILSSTFAKPEFKKPLKRLHRYLREKNIPLKVFLLRASDEEIARRIEKRKKGKSLSNIDSMEKYLKAKSFFRKIDFVDAIDIDTEAHNHFSIILRHLEELTI